MAKTKKKKSKTAPSPQTELKGEGFQKNQVQQFGELVIRAWEEVKDKKSNMKVAEDRLREFCKKFPGISRIGIMDSIGVKRMIKVNRVEEQVKFRIGKAKKGE